MCGPVTAVVTAVQAAAAVAQGFQRRQQGRFQQDVARFNARQQENEATLTRRRAVEEETEQRRATAELISRQRAVLGAAGVDVEFGSALQLQQDAAALDEIEARRIRSNIGLQAESLEQQAEITRAEGTAARRAGDVAFGTSILGAAGRIADSPFGERVAGKWFNRRSVAAQASQPTPILETTATP